MKAQAMSLDLIIAIIILLIIISGIGFILIEFSNFQEQSAKNRDMLLKGQSATSSLVQTPGNPPNWEEY